MHESPKQKIEDKNPTPSCRTDGRPSRAPNKMSHTIETCYETGEVCVCSERRLPGEGENSQTPDLILCVLGVS
jgi:hypothetical protein